MIDPSDVRTAYNNLRIILFDMAEHPQFDEERKKIQEHVDYLRDLLESIYKANQDEIAYQSYLKISAKLAETKKRKIEEMQARGIAIIKQNDRAAMKARNEAIYADRLSGMTYAAIARKYVLSETRISGICRKQERKYSVVSQFENSPCIIGDKVTMQ